MKSVIQNTIAIIEKQGVKRCVVAKRAGYSAQQFSDLLNSRKLFKADDVIRVANALGVTPNDLFGFTTNKTA